MPTIEIDGRTLEADSGTMIIEVADRAGIYIPRFCYHEKLSIAANCRMCLVDVEKAPKPLPACATPVTDGMKVFTASAKAVAAQKGTMEFLLINHPLDCPVCDQGGECPLQDQAMGYGSDVSRFSERKRVVEDKDIGPLIATEMTRCIHCTRCVRFGQEIAGVMELGATGRGEHLEIETFVDQGVNSELSGNMIDLCPVGALTSKPYRFSARAWELVGHDGIASHDCVGSNLEIQSLRGVVKRVLPRTNEDINECWLADRDRYSYQAWNSDERLTQPLIRIGGEWQQTDWSRALEFASTGLMRAVNTYSAKNLGALVSPAASCEELFLSQKLMRGLGSHHIDHRLRQCDFRDDELSPLRPGLATRLAGVEQAKVICLVGANPRKEQPLLGLRIRKAALAGARVFAVDGYDHDFHFATERKQILAPAEMAAFLARTVKAVYGRKSVPDGVAAWAGGKPGEGERELAKALRSAGDDAQLIVGLAALSNRNYSVIRAMCQLIAGHTGARLGILCEGNGVGAWLAGCVPHRGPEGAPAFVRGMNVAEMLSGGLRGYLLVGVEPGLDCIGGDSAEQAMAAAEFVVSLSAYDNRATTAADVLLPMCVSSETAATYVNCEGIVQSVEAAAKPPGEARPGWKILRVLGNLLQVEGFDYVSAAQVREEVNWESAADATLMPEVQIAPPADEGERAQFDLERVLEVPPYRVDAVVRRATALQQTADNPPPVARLSPAQAARIGVADGDGVIAHMGESGARLAVRVDPRVPDGCVYIPTAWEATAGLPGAGLVRVVRT